MSFPIEFEKKENYDSLETGITIDAILRYGNREQICQVKVDIGGLPFRQNCSRFIRN